MNSVFISGIPTAGKSYLAIKLARITGLPHVDLDTFRKGMKKDSKLEKWVNFYQKQDPYNYYIRTSCEKQWKNLKKQSEALWPTLHGEIKSQSKKGPAIFDGVNLLPHLVKADLKFKGIYLLGKSYKTTLTRLKEKPRWGKTLKSQKAQTKSFIECENKWYKNEADKYGYKSFNSSTKAEKELLRMI